VRDDGIFSICPHVEEGLLRNVERMRCVFSMGLMSMRWLWWLWRWVVVVVVVGGW